jgi:hypothetical protein
VAVKRTINIMRRPFGSIRSSNGGMPLSYSGKFVSGREKFDIKLESYYTA